MVIISSIPISGCIAGTVSTTGTFSVGDLRNLGQWNHNCAKRLCKYWHEAISVGFKSSRIGL